MDGFAPFAPSPFDGIAAPEKQGVAVRSRLVPAIARRCRRQVADEIADARPLQRAKGHGAAEVHGGDAVRADPCEADLWARRAAAQHSEVARHHKALLNGMREVRGGRAGCVDR